MNDEAKHPRPPIKGEAEFMASKAADSNGGAGEPEKKPIKVALDRENFRAIGYVLAVYRDAAKMRPDPDGPPIGLIEETKKKIDTLIENFSTGVDNG